MANQYGTKAWAEWASQNLDFALELLRDPNKRWEEQVSYLQCAIKSLNSIQTELEKTIKGGK